MESRLPALRAGSTLLAALLRQNPRFHASMTSGLGALVSGAMQIMSPGGEVALTLEEGQREDILRSLFDSYYQHGISGSWNSGTGVLTLTGSATKANYETALESVTYQNTNTANPNTSNRTVTWVVNDGDANSTGVTSMLTVAGVNDAPTVTASGGTAVTLDAGSNADHSHFNGGNVTVSVTANAQTGEDVLGIANQGSGAGQISASSGNVGYGGTAIGTYAGGSNGNNLVISYAVPRRCFLAGANPAR